jgi:Glycosyltransferase family 17
MKVYDCFTFHNEFDILELRLEELWDVVDYFVIAEANVTHQSQPKPYLLEERWDTFAKYHSKIRHIKVDDMPCTSNTWANENWQRRALQRGLYDRQPEDLIITGDADEIVRPEIINLIKNDVNDYNRYVPLLPLFYFKLNFLMVNPTGLHGRSVVTRSRAFLDPQREREITFPWIPKPDNVDYCFINHGGWHFSYFGKTDFAKTKIQSFAHSETNIPSIVDHLDVDEMIKHKVGIGWEKGEERFAYVHIKDYMPQTVINNLERWKDMIIDQQEFSVYDFYPNIEITPENIEQHVNRINGTFLQLYKKLVHE